MPIFEGLRDDIRARGDNPAMTLDLAEAFAAVAPNADPTVWLPPLQIEMAQAGLNNASRVAAFLGQCVVETAGFTSTIENLDYTHADRLCAIYPNEIPNETSAAPYLGNPKALANLVYANKLGNGDIASGDGWLFRGRGLIQITGRDDYTAFADAIGLSPQDAAAYAETPAGAVASGCWYWNANGLSVLADGWRISAITRLVNGQAMLKNSERIAASNLALEKLTV